MKKSFHSVACAATIATTMLLQIFAPSVVLAIDTTEDTEPSTTIETTVTSETSIETSADVIEPSDTTSDNTNYTEVIEDLTETEADVTEVTEEEVVSSETNTDPTGETVAETEETTIETEEPEYEFSVTLPDDITISVDETVTVTASVIATETMGDVTTDLEYSFEFTGEGVVFSDNTSTETDISFTDAGVFVVTGNLIVDGEIVAYDDMVITVTELSTVEITTASDMDEFLSLVSQLPSVNRVIVSTTEDITSNIEHAEGVYFDGVYVISFLYNSSYSNAISYFTESGISYCIDGVVETTGLTDISLIDNVEINAVGEVRVAIIDTGSNLANESYSVIGDYTGDDNGHGTRMAQLVLENDADNAYIISIKALGSDGHGSIVDVYNAVQLALELDVDYILMSFSTINSTEYTAFRELLVEANNAGVGVVASAGNNGMNASFYVPASVSETITVGALNVDYTKQSFSNYGSCVDYYVVADSTSDAAAMYIGYVLSGQSDKIFTTYLDESASLTDSELYALYSSIAREITAELVAEYGYGECRLEIDETGEYRFVYVFEGSASSDVVINARPDSELRDYATTDIGASPVPITDGMSGTDSGTAVYTQGSYPGWGSISSISSSGTTGSGLRLTQFASTMAVCCSRAFTGENSRYATPLTDGQAVEYSASYTVSGGRITWTVMVGAPGRNLTQPSWEPRSLSTTWRIAVQGGSTGVEYVAYVNGSGAGTASATEAGAINTITSAVNAAVADIARKIAQDEFGATRGLNTSGLPRGVGSGTAVSTWEVTVDPQIFEGILSAGQPDTPHGAVSFIKVDATSGQALSGCVAYLLCTGGEGVGHTSELRVFNANSPSPVTFSGNSGVQFTTNGNTVTIENLSPNSSYMFYEYSTPIDPSTGLPYDLASPQSCTFSTNANGDIVNVSVSGDWSYSSGTATVTLKNGHTTNPNFSSIGVLKVWPANATNNFWQDTQFLQFAIQYGGNWETYQQYGWGDSWSYGRIRNPDRNAGQAYVGWLTQRDSAIAYGGTSLYLGDNQYIPGRYYQHIGPDGRMVDNEGASYDWNHDLLYLPYGYYHITEYWREAYISAEGQAEFAASANASGWTLESGGPGTGSCQYGIIIKIDGNGTWICDSNGNIVSGLPVSGGVRLESVTNDTLEAALDVRKIDLTGGGIDGASFELYNSNNARIATGSIASTPSGTTTDTYGNTVNYYDVSWNYQYNQAYRTDASAWYYNTINLTNQDVVQHLNYTTYQIREYITDMRGYRVPEGWEGMDADGDGVYEYFYKNVTMSADYHNEPLTVDCANRQYRLRVTANKVDQWSGQIITNYGGSYEANPREDVYEATVYNLAPSIATTLHDPVTMSQTAHVDDDIELIDTVSYTNLVPNVEVRLDAVIMVKESGQPLLDANGNQVTGYAVFTPQTPNGTVDVTIHVNTNYVMSLVEDGTLNAPVDLVCFETLSFTATTDLTPYHQWYDENPIAEHKEIDDLGQTVRVAEIRTGIYDNQTLSQVASDGPNGDGYAVLIDHVHYEGLAPGHTYTMRGEMHLLAYDDNGNPIDGGVLEGADAREILHPTTTFTPTEQEGYVDVTYVINANRFRGETTVSYEYCEDNGRTIVFHNDIEDLPQTVFFPNVHTNAYCPDTTPGEMGRTVIGLQQRARIVDEVSYENLLVDGRQYMIQGCLYWMYTDENGTIHSGPMADIIGEAQAMSTIFFTPTEQDGTIEMTFTFDSTVLADLHYDRLVVCESIFANGGIGWKRIANHWDFRYENNAQSIYVPDVHTTASTAVGQTLPEGQNPDIMPVTVSDRVFYENLVPGTEYTVVGNLQYAITDSNGNITESGALVQNGQEVKAQKTFVPTSSSGYVDLEFTVNAADIMAHGYDRLVAFEEVYVGPGVLVALHADITDEEQTVYVPDLETTALGANGRHSVQAAANTEIIDTVAYTGLTVGREYRLETDLMSSKTGTSIAHVTTTFVPTTPDGVVRSV